MVDEKRCTNCKVVKPIEQFYRNRCMKDGRTSQCAECLKARSIAYMKTIDPEVKRQRGRETKDRHRERVREEARRWRANNHELAVERARESRQKESYKEWEKAYKADKRARMRGSHSGGPISRIGVAERDGWRCHLCGGKVTKDNWSIDHLVPLSKGGDHTLENVALAHYRCNVVRGAGRQPAQLRLIG